MEELKLIKNEEELGKESIEELSNGKGDEDDE